MTIVDTLADLQKFQIILDCLLVLFDVIIEYSYGIIGPPFVSDLSRTSTAKGKHLVVLKSPHDGDEGGVVDPLIEFLRFLLRSFVEEGVVLGDSGGRIEE
jgi:hypothetical protein